jgi:hypothetical protein
LTRKMIANEGYLFNSGGDFHEPECVQL